MSYPFAAIANLSECNGIYINGKRSLSEHHRGTLLPIGGVAASAPTGRTRQTLEQTVGFTPCVSYLDDVLVFFLSHAQCLFSDHNLIYLVIIYLHILRQDLTEPRLALNSAVQLRMTSILEPSVPHFSGVEIAGMRCQPYRDMSCLLALTD